MIPPTYEMVESKNKLKNECEDFEAQAINISGGNRPNKDSETRKIVNITIGEHVSTKLVKTEPISTTKESINSKNKINIRAINPPLKAVPFMKE
jgi:hypothetical protein